MIMADILKKQNNRHRRHVSFPERAALVISGLWHNKWWIILLMIAVAAVFSWHSAQVNQRTASATLVLRYEQAYEGLNPNGTRFNIYELMSGSVLALMELLPRI